MADTNPSGFENAVNTFNTLAAAPPVPKEALLGSLAAARAIGEAEARSDSHDLGTTRYAVGMTALYRTALSLDDARNVQPPFTHRDKKKLTDQLDILSSITHENGGDGPTDTGTIKTSGRK